MDSSALWGLLGTVVGALASIATTWLAARSSHELERAKSREDRKEQARTFQRQTLLELQDAVHDAIRFVKRAQHADLLAHRSGQDWSKIKLPEELDTGVSLALRRVFLLVERVADDQLRASVKQFTEHVTQVLLAHTEQESRAHLDKTTLQVMKLFEEMGTVLRRYYEPVPAQ
ncbi:MAG: hypothetical protein Q8K57_16660 [Thiobacillus sp.]|nr:hypothetical protein [Thiobacillus sp.]MDP3125998.1 hypothetical protein [Thiobacillus sp.]